jgi:hypothetical protein
MRARRRAGWGGSRTCGLAYSLWCWGGEPISGQGGRGVGDLWMGDWWWETEARGRVLRSGKAWDETVCGPVEAGLEVGSGESLALALALARWVEFALGGVSQWSSKEFSCSVGVHIAGAAHAKQYLMRLPRQSLQTSPLLSNDPQQLVFPRIQEIRDPCSEWPVRS